MILAIKMNLAFALPLMVNIQRGLQQLGIKQDSEYNIHLPPPVGTGRSFNIQTDYFKIVQFLFLKGLFYINTYLVNIYKGLLIVIKNDLKIDRFRFVFIFFEKRQFRFWKKTIVFKNEPLVVNFQKRFKNVETIFSYISNLKQHDIQAKFAFPSYV